MIHDLPPESRPRRTRRWRRLGLLLVLALLPRLFFELHHVDGLSMWPAFNESGGGEWLLVLRDWADREVKVWDPIVVTDPEDSDRSLLKRVCALPGALPRIEDGDLLLIDAIGGLEHFVPRSLDQIQDGLVPIADLASLSFRRRGREGEIVDSFRRVFVVPAVGRAALSDRGSELLVEAAADGRASLRFPAEDFRDDHRGVGGRMEAGEHLVRDLALTFAFAAEALPRPGQRILFRHVLERDGEGEELEILVTEETYELRARGRGDGEARASLPRRPELVMRWLLVDDHRSLLFAPDGSTDAFELAFDSRRDLVPQSTRSYIKLDTEGGSVVLSRLDTDRDLHYTPPSDGAARNPADGVELPREQLFLLGDNGPASRDSRQWRRDVVIDRIGRPVLVIWPLSRARILD
ncbi:MAG: hypothetical protein H6807_13400 [Planctomycetes bacterium]|nr:hypothetical protein [Planctomycetota bacterium]